MAGIFGVVSKEDCGRELFYGTHYLQHRAQGHCGLAVSQEDSFYVRTSRGLLKEKINKEEIISLKGNFGIGSVSSERQPISVLSGSGGMFLAFDGNVINYLELRDRILKEGETFAGYSSPNDIKDVALISKIVSKETNFEKGIEKLVREIQGDFSIIALNKKKIYAARGWGRKPLILGKKDRAYAVSSESNSFPNIGFEIYRDVEPGEIVSLDLEGIHNLGKLNLKPIKYGTFEWIYTSHPVSIIDGKSVSEVRKLLGGLLAKNYPVKADVVSPVPNSGRWHAIGYAQESQIPYEEVFIRYDYSDRSYTSAEQKERNEEAGTKLIPIKNSIQGKRIVLVDDSIVRGTQMLNRSRVLKELGAKEVHARIACPPLMAACAFGKTTKKDEDCIARRMPLEEIKEKLNLDSLKYATVEMLESAIGISRDNLCLDCWSY